MRLLRSIFVPGISADFSVGKIGKLWQRFENTNRPGCAFLSGPDSVRSALLVERLDDARKSGEFEVAFDL